MSLTGVWMTGLRSILLVDEVEDGALVDGEEGREQEAIRTLRRAVALAPNSETAWQMLGYSY